MPAGLELLLELEAGLLVFDRPGKKLASILPSWAPPSGRGVPFRRAGFALNILAWPAARIWVRSGFKLKASGSYGIDEENEPELKVPGSPRAAKEGSKSVTLKSIGGDEIWHHQTVSKVQNLAGWIWPLVSAQGVKRRHPHRKTTIRV